MIRAGIQGDLPLGLARDDRDRARAQTLGDLQRRGSNAAGGSMDQHRLALA